MKTNNLFGIWLLFLCATVLSGCNNYLLNGKDGDEEEDNEEVWYNNIPEGNFFSRGNTLRFYYIDEKGNDLINPSDLKTFPVSWNEELDNPLERTYDNIRDVESNTIRYNGNHNWILYDSEEQLHYCTVSAYGDERQSTYTFPIYVNGDTDKMEITYKYTDKGVVGGKYWGKIVSWKYNGTHIYLDDDEYDKKIFIRKANGNTIVSFTR